MQVLHRQIAQLALVAALASVATLLVCRSFPQVVLPQGPVDGAPPRALADPEPTTKAFVKWKPNNEHQDEVSGCFDDDAFTKRYAFSWMMEGLSCSVGFLIFRWFANAYMMGLCFCSCLLWESLNWGSKAKSIWREANLQLMVLNIFFSEQQFDVVRNNRFASTCLFLFIEESITQYVNYKRHYGPQQYGEEDLKRLQIVNRYQKLSTRIGRVTLLCVCQLMLGLFYFYAFLQKIKNPQVLETSSGVKWTLAFLLCNAAGEHEVGESFQQHFWLTVMKNLKEEQHPSACCQFFSCKYMNELRARRLFSILVNMYLRRIIFCSAPVLLALENDTLDFLKDVMAVFFITKLDEIDDPLNFHRDLPYKIRHLFFPDETTDGPNQDDPGVCGEFQALLYDVPPGQQDNSNNIAQSKVVTKEDLEVGLQTKVTQKDLEDCLQPLREELKKLQEAIEGK